MPGVGADLGPVADPSMAWLGVEPKVRVDISLIDPEEAGLKPSGQEIPEG